jgi:hypothetical protein
MFRCTSAFSEPPTIFDMPVAGGRPLFGTGVVRHNH